MKAIDSSHVTRALGAMTGIVGAEADYGTEAAGTYTLPAGQAARSLLVLYPTTSLAGIAVRGGSAGRRPARACQSIARTSCCFASPPR